MSETLVQHVNRRTAGVINPANAVSMLGRWLVQSGARQMDGYRGPLKMAGGRILDLVDGPLARRLGVSSRLGAGVDAIGDKVDIFTIVRAARQQPGFKTGMLAAFAVQNTANAALTTYGEVNGRPVTKSWAGERTMFAQSTALVAHNVALVARRREHNAVATSFEALSKTARVAAYALGTVATVGYAIDACNLTERYPRATDALRRVMSDEMLEKFIHLPDDPTEVIDASLGS